VFELMLVSLAVRSSEAVKIVPELSGQLRMSRMALWWIGMYLGVDVGTVGGWVRNSRE
jgi:hypothetical protein